MISEKQFNKKATTDAFDEIYTNFDVASISEEYLADSGYPFDFPTRWLNDPSMNKRIAIRRLDVIPSTHVFALQLVYVQTDDATDFDQKINMINYSRITVTEHENLNKVLSYICDSLSTYDTDTATFDQRLIHEYTHTQPTVYYALRASYTIG